MQPQHPQYHPNAPANKDERTYIPPGMAPPPFGAAMSAGAPPPSVPNAPPAPYPGQPPAASMPMGRNPPLPQSSMAPAAGPLQQQPPFMPPPIAQQSGAHQFLPAQQQQNYPQQYHQNIPNSTPMPQQGLPRQVLPEQQQQGYPPQHPHPSQGSHLPTGGQTHPALPPQSQMPPALPNLRQSLPPISNPPIPNPQVAHPQMPNPQMPNPQMAHPQIPAPQMPYPQMPTPQVPTPQAPTPQMPNPSNVHPAMPQPPMPPTSNPASQPQLQQGAMPPMPPASRPGAMPIPQSGMPAAMDQMVNQMQNLSTAYPQADRNFQPAMTSPPVQLMTGPAPPESVNFFPPLKIQPNIDPAYSRCTLAKVPKSQAVLTKSQLPFAITVTPYPTSQEPVPLINGPIVRCRTCRTYLNPFVEMVEQGARWKCNLCFLINDFPPSYDYDSATQTYIDRKSRPELTRTVYEFIAPMEYMVRPPQPAAYLFVIDVSFTAISTGMVATAARVILESLDQIPNEQGRTRIGFITFDKHVHFYQINPNSDDSKMLVMSDLKDVFLPSPDDLLVSLTDCRKQIEQLLAKLSNSFANTQEVNPALGPALNASSKLMAAIGGKVTLLLSSMPTSHEGALKPRSDPKALGTTQESALLRPESTYYKIFATECSRNQICIDLFLFPVQYIDVASLSCCTKYTGGKLYYYPGFNAARSEDAAKFARDFSSFLGKEIGLEAVIRIRASQGISIAAYHGSFFLRSTDLLSLPNVNPDHSYTAQLVVDETLQSPVACFQTAVLHTTCHGERRIRVLNMALPVTEDAKELFLNADQGAIMSVLSKMAVDKILSDKLEDSRDAIIKKCVDILSAYRAAFNSGVGATLLICENLRALPLLTLALLKSVAIRTGNTVMLDLRSYMMVLLKTLSVDSCTSLLHPYLASIHNMAPQCGLPDEKTGRIVLPHANNLSSERLERHGMYILDNGLDIFIWVGSAIHPELCELIFGKPLHQLEAGKITLPVLENSWSQRFGNILGKLREKHSNNPYVYLIKEDSDVSMRRLFLTQLVEDKTGDDQLSYPQWLNTLNNKVNSGSS